MPSNYTNIPGVEYTSKDGEKFYADVLWAMVLGSRQNLEDMLQMDEQNFTKRLRELSLDDLMRKTYTLAGYLIKKSKKASCTNNISSKAIRWYYHNLSPIAVPWLLDHPYVNRCAKKITNLASDVALYVLRLDTLKGKEIFDIKKSLISFKTVQYQAQPDDEIKQFLSTYHDT